MMWGGDAASPAGMALLEGSHSGTVLEPVSAGSGVCFTVVFISPHSAPELKIPGIKVHL